jgi:hypothetical protein
MTFSFLFLLSLIHGIKGTFKFCDSLLNQMKINDGGFDGGMPKELLNGEKVCPLGKEMGCKTMSEAMQPATSFYIGFFFALIKAPLAAE